MICDICQKREAVIYYTKVINGTIEELQLCEECSKQNEEFQIDESFSFHKILSTIFDSNIQGTKEEQEDIKCPNCHMDYSEFQDVGKIGCSQCYLVFRDRLDSLVRNVQGGKKHTGKIPKIDKEKYIIKREVAKLRENLQEAIIQERFEDAADLRDKIKDLELESKEGGLDG